MPCGKQSPGLENKDCWHCGKTGHLATFCYARKAGKPRVTGIDQKPVLREATMSIVNIEALNSVNDLQKKCLEPRNLLDTHNLYLDHMSHVLKIDFLKATKMVRPHLDCVVMGQVKTSALYDTGADIRCMALSTFRTIPLPFRPKRKQVPPVLAKGANNRVLEAVGSYDFELQFKDRKVTQQW